MVGLTDIPCVGVAVNRISEATVEAVIRGLRYLLCSKNLVNDLKAKIEKAGNVEDVVVRKVKEAKDDGKIIEKFVESWQEDGENIKTKAEELSRVTTFCTCFNVVRFPNPVSHFRLGRKAAHLTTVVTEHTDSGEKFLVNEIAYHPPNENLPLSDASYQNFGSRQEAYRELWDKLVNKDGYPIVAIYGMAGVGKTRTMEQVWKEAKEKKIFDKVTRANVGNEKLDVIKLQEELASYLDCHLESKSNEVKRAAQLKESLMNGKKILVILDDVWDVIPLIRIGIPYGDGSSKGCKILLTSRKRTVCLRNDAKDPIEIKTLTYNEAWEMFKISAGTSTIESLNDTLLAEKVCKRCASLPLVINAVGSALKCASKSTWKDALYKLETCKFEEIDGIDSEVNTCIQVSFEKLAEGEKKCLFLCSYFPEDADIRIKVLSDLATASGLLESGRDIHGVVDILKSSSLLLQGRDDDTVKLHDVIRDVARSIAARDDKYAFLSVRCTSWLPDDNVEYPTRRFLHLDLVGETVCFPDDLMCPKLHTLWVQSNNHSQQLSSGFFNAFKNLKVLLLQGMSLREEQLSIYTLQKLRVLILDRCKISQAFLNSVSESLETLCIWKCNFPQPLLIPELKVLRKLELLQSGTTRVILNSLLSLPNVEELNIPNGFKIYHDGKYSKGFYVFDWNMKKRCEIKSAPNLGENGLMPLVELAEEVELTSVAGLPNGFSESKSREAFGNLRTLRIHCCDDINHVARWQGRNQWLTCFTNVIIVKIYGCNRLKYLFSSRVAKCLLQMQYLSVSEAFAVEEIVSVDDGTDHGEEVICFPKLQELDLYGLSSLTSFISSSTFTLKMPALHTVSLYDCPSLDKLTSLLIGAPLVKNYGNTNISMMFQITEEASDGRRRGGR